MRAAIILLFVLAMAVPAAAQVGPPTEYLLQPTFPEPFCGTVAIGFQLPQASQVEVSILDPGDDSLIRLLVYGMLPAGSHQILWDAHDDQGESVPDGVYAVHMVAWIDGGTIPEYEHTVLATQSCSVPGEDAAWGAVKSLYR